MKTLTRFVLITLTLGVSLVASVLPATADSTYCAASVYTGGYDCSDFTTGQHWAVRPNASGGYDVSGDQQGVISPNAYGGYGYNGFTNNGQTAYGTYTPNAYGGYNYSGISSSGASVSGSCEPTDYYATGRYYRNANGTWVPNYAASGATCSSS